MRLSLVVPVAVQDGDTVVVGETVPEVVELHVRDAVVLTHSVAVSVAEPVCDALFVALAEKLVVDVNDAVSVGVAEADSDGDTEQLPVSEPDTDPVNDLVEVDVQLPLAGKLALEPFPDAETDSSRDVESLRVGDKLKVTVGLRDADGVADRVGL